MKKLLILLVSLFLCNPVFAADRAMKFPSGTPLEVYTPSNPQSAGNTSITDTGEYFSSDNVEGALQELGAGGGGMVYPDAGIAVSTGSAWGTSITDNHSNWDTAYSWGNHSEAGYLTSESDPIASPTALSFSINGWGQAISTTPVWHQPVVPSNMTITSWSLDGDVSGGDLEVDVQVSTSSPYTSYSSICGTEKPNVTGAYTNTSSTLTGWTTNLTEGTRVRIVPSAGATHKKAQLTLFGDKT